MTLLVIALCVAISTVAVIILTGVVWLLRHGDDLGERVLAVARRCHLLRRPLPALTSDQPIERIAADLRRLSAAIGQLRAGTSAIRRRALVSAYDSNLVAACRALGVPNSLDELREGMDREIEKMRMEAALERAGLRFRSATS
jgi:hypothetical protein